MSLKYHYGGIRGSESLQRLVVYKWCASCKQPKPPRTHHCSVCGKCIMKMDHHCPWVGSCVGFKNHKHFILFMLYVNIGCMYALVTMVPFTFRQWFDSNLKKKMEAAGLGDNGWLLIGPVLCITFLCMVLGLMILHC